MDVVLTVTEARQKLRRLIDDAAAGRVTFIGAHRRPEVAIVGAGRLSGAPPPHVLGYLLQAQATATAHHLRCLDDSQRGTAVGRDVQGLVWPPGDRFGDVLAWLWDTDQPDRAVQLVTDLLLQSRHVNPRRVERGPSLDELLTDLALSLPPSFMHAVVLTEHLRQELSRTWDEVPVESAGPPATSEVGPAPGESIEADRSAPAATQEQSRQETSPPPRRRRPRWWVVEVDHSLSANDHSPVVLISSHASRPAADKALSRHRGRHHDIAGDIGQEVRGERDITSYLDWDSPAGRGVTRQGPPPR